MKAVITFEGNAFVCKVQSDKGCKIHAILIARLDSLNKFEEYRFINFDLTVPYFQYYCKWISSLSYESFFKFIKDEGVYINVVDEFELF